MNLKEIEEEIDIRELAKHAIKNRMEKETDTPKYLQLLDDLLWEEAALSILHREKEKCLTESEK